jgi:hypothetical protein
VAQLKIRFRLVSNSSARVGRLDHISIVGTGSGSGTWTASVQVELIDPSATATTLKAYGAADANPYTVTTQYTGAGTYQIRITEKDGGFAYMTTPALEGMSATLAHCHYTNCGSAPPPEVSHGDTPATALNWNSDKTTMNWQAVAEPVDSYRLYKGQPADLYKLLTSNPDACVRNDADVLSYNMTWGNDSPAAGTFLWFLVTAVNTAGEGPAGDATAGARQLSSTGACTP